MPHTIRIRLLSLLAPMLFGAAAFAQVSQAQGSKTVAKPATATKPAAPTVKSAVSPTATSTVTSKAGPIEVPRERTTPRLVRPELVLQTGHSNGVTSMSFSPDGHILASGGWDDTIKLWDTRSGALFKTLSAPQNDKSTVASVVFSPDGKQLASGGMDSTVKLWDVKTGTLIKALSGHRNWVHSVAFSPDSKIVASASKDDSVRLWDARTGAPLRTLWHNSKEYSVTLAAFSPDGRIVVSSSGDGTVKLWNAGSGAWLKTLKGRADSVAFSPDGKTLLCSNGYDAITLWDVDKGTVVKTIKVQSKSLELMAFTADGKTFASATSYDDLRVWDARSGARVKSLTSRPDDYDIYAAVAAGTAGKVEWLSSLAFSRNSRVLATGGSDDGTIKLWDVQSGALLCTMKGYQDWVTALAFSPDGTALLSGNYRSLKLWDANGGALLKTLNPPGKGEGQVESTRVDSAIFSPDGQTLVTGNEHDVRLWDRQSGALLQTLKAAGPVAFSPDGKTLVSSGFGHQGDSDQTPLRFWDARSGAPLKALSNKQSVVWSIAYSPDGKLLASGGMDDTVKLWDAATGALLHTMNGGDDVRAVAFSPDGKTLASGGRDKTVKLWDAQSGKLRQTLTGHSGGIQSLAFSPDGSTLASGSHDGTTKLWDARTGALLKTLVGHRNWVWTVAFSPDGKRLATGGMDDTINLWDARSGALLATFIKLPGAAESIKSGFKALSLGARPLSLGSRNAALAEGEWFIMTPQGWFDCSANASRFIRWRTRNAIWDLHPAERYYRRLRRPDMVQMALRGEAIPEADLSNLDVPPQAQFTRVQYEGDKAAETVTATLEVRGRGDFKDVTVLVNGRPLPPENEAPLAVSEVPANVEAPPLAADAKPLSLGSRALDIQARPLSIGARPVETAANAAAPESDTRYSVAKRYTFKVPLPVGASEIKLRAFAYDTADLGSNPTEITLSRPATKRVPGNLYILCAGIGTYKNGSDGKVSDNTGFSNLKFAAQDAQSLVDRLKTESAPLYDKVEVFNGGPLLNEQASLANLRAGLKWLQSKARPGQIDTVVIYLSGHGLSDPQGRYYFPTYEFDKANWQSTSLSGRELQAELGGKLRARSVFLFVDTCHSGALAGARSDDLNFEVNSSGVYMLASSGSTQYSYESDKWGHGAFTLALLRSLARKELAPDGTIKFNVLTYAIPDEIAKLMKEAGQSENAMAPVVPLEGRRLDEPVAQVK